MKHSADHTNTGQDWYFYLCTSMPEGVTVTFNGVTCDLIADPDDGSERSVAVAYGVTAWPWQNTTDNIGLSDIIFHVDWPGASAAEINALLNGNTLVGDISISDTAYRPTPTP